MEVHWTVHIPQAMQRHTGCAWEHPATAEEKRIKPEDAESRRDGVEKKAEMPR